MSSIKPVIQSGIARTISFVPAAVATLLTSRLIIHHYGVGPFDSFALMTSLIALLPLNDLGVGAAVTSAVAQRGATSPYSQRVLLTSARVLAVSTLGVVGVSAVLAAGGLWPRLLGPASGQNTFVALAMAVYALSFLPGLGQRLLLGVQRNHVTVVIQTFFTPVILLLTAVLVTSHTGPRYLVVVPPAAIVVINLVTLSVGIRATRFPWRQVARRLPSPSRFPGESIRALSGPMLITTLAVPIALQSDRIVLSHVASRQAVANYSVVIQIFAPVTALVAASAWPLWPIWAKARVEGRKGPSLVRIIAVFTGAAGLLCACLVVVADPVGRLIGNGHIQLGWELPIAAALAVITQSAAYPLGMKLTDPAGIRFVALCTVLALPLNVGLSIWLGHTMGAPGPLFATFGVGSVVQLLPTLLYNRRHETVGRHRADARAGDVAMMEPGYAALGMMRTEPVAEAAAEPEAVDATR